MAEVSVQTGLLILAACLPIGIVALVSGKYQGKAAAGAIGVVAKKPEPVSYTHLKLGNAGGAFYEKVGPFN